MLDINDHKTRAGLGCIFSLLRSRLSKSEFARLKLLIPEMEKLIQEGIAGSAFSNDQYLSSSRVRNFIDLAARFKSIGLRSLDIKVFFSCLVEYISEHGDVPLAKRLSELVASSVIFPEKDWQIYRTA